MKVLVIGSGGREHALTWKIAQSRLVTEVFCAPGNPGMAQHGNCVDIGVNEFDKLEAFAKDQRIDLTVVGPEAPLAAGIVDRFEGAGLNAFGPTAAAAQIEASKSFSKDLMRRYDIPTGRSREFTDPHEATAYIKDQGVPIVVKADGLAAGKGVTVANDLDTALRAVHAAMVEKAFGEAGNKVVVEECLVGEEASILALTDGDHIVLLAPSQDHKPIYDGDQGPNTGGMGAYSPAPVVTPDLLNEIKQTILDPCVKALAEEGRRYQGVLYAGLMVTDTGPQVVEFNCRFGDPETQVVLPRMTSDLVPLLLACCNGTLSQVHMDGEEGACVTVVMASGGYPGAYDKGKRILGIDKAEGEQGCLVFHAGTRLDSAGLVTNGGRVLNVTALGPDIPTAIDKAYEGVRQITFEGAYYRGDIGQKALIRLGRRG